MAERNPRLTRYSWVLTSQDQSGSKPSDSEANRLIVDGFSTRFQQAVLSQLNIVEGEAKIDASTDNPVITGTFKVVHSTDNSGTHEVNLTRPATDQSGEPTSPAIEISIVHPNDPDDVKHWLTFTAYLTGRLVVAASNGRDRFFVDTDRITDPGHLTNEFRSPILRSALSHFQLPSLDIVKS